MKAKISKSHKFVRNGIADKEPKLIECSISQLTFIDSLIETCTLQQYDINRILNKTKYFLSEGQAEEIITFLLENQRCNIDGGFNYSQTDILNKLKQLT